MKVFKYLKLISRKTQTFNVALNIFSIIEKTRMLADLYIPTLSNDMNIAVQKNHLVSEILYKSLVPSKKRRQYFALLENFSAHRIGVDVGARTSDLHMTKMGALNLAQFLQTSRFQNMAPYWKHDMVLLDRASWLKRLPDQSLLSALSISEEWD